MIEKNVTEQNILFTGQQLEWFNEDVKSVMHFGNDTLENGEEETTEKSMTVVDFGADSTSDSGAQINSYVHD